MSREVAKFTQSWFGEIRVNEVKHEDLLSKTASSTQNT